MRRLTRLAGLTLPAAALAAAVQAYASTVPVVEPYVSVAPSAPGRVEAATTIPASPAAAPTPSATPRRDSAVASPKPHLPAPTARPAATPPPAIRDLLRSADGTLDTAVTTYSDCSGATPLTHSEAAVDTCVKGRTYFVGHNPGVFTPLMTENVGAVITWWDGSGTAHNLRIVAVRTWQRVDGVPPAVSGDVVAQFQTCQVLDGSLDRILDAVNA